MRDDDKVWEQLVELLKGRPGWKVQALSTPGAHPAWCFGSGGETELSVTTQRGSISLYVVERDEEIDLQSTGELVEWLKAHRAGSLQDPRTRVVDRIRRGGFFEWE